MKPLDITVVEQYVRDHIAIFHQKRIDRLGSLNLKTVLRKKNPYLFRAKHLLTAENIVRGLTDAFISSHEETLFGDWLEGLAIFVNSQVFDGRKSGIKGIDLEFDHGGVRYIVAIKSGPNWGNSSQINKMISDFQMARRTLRTSGGQTNVVAVNGCCYGQDARPDKGEYLKYCGQRFWDFISGDPNMYLDIIAPLGYEAQARNEAFITAYAAMVNRFTQEFAQDFCNPQGYIDWPRLVAFNAGIRP